METSNRAAAVTIAGTAFAVTFGGGSASAVLASGLVLLGVTLSPTTARAQDAEAPVTLEPVVVQARRRDEKLMEAPIAVTEQTGEQLREQNAVLFEDIARLVPNLRMMQSPQSVSALDITLRGQTAIRSAINYDAAVGLYIDGVYVADGQAAMGTLLDIDNVQVVRGAQGTQFGRNNTGGAILVTTRRPQLGVAFAEAAVEAGNSGLFTGRAIANVPLGDRLALRLAYQDNERDGYGSSIASGQNDFANQHRYQARASALWKPGAGFEAFMTYEHFEAREAGALLHPLRGTLVEQIGQAIDQLQQAGQLPLGIASVLFPPGLYQTDSNRPSHDRSHLDAAQLTLTQSLGEAARAKLILAYRRLANDTAIDVDASSLPFADTLLANTSRQKSAELQLSGAALDRRLDWVGGLYWFRDDGSAPSVIPAQPQAYQSLFQSLGVLQIVPFPVVETNSVRNDSSAAFVHGEYKLTDRWAVAAGVRRTVDQRRLSENTYADTPIGQACTIIDADTGLPPGFPNPTPCPPFDKRVGFSYWSWEFSTRYRVSDTINTYFRTGRGQRSGGWNVPVNTFQDQPFRPEQLTDFEFGIKVQALGGAWLTTADVFYSDYRDMQRLMPSLVGGTPTTFVVNAGKARVGGAEVESTLLLSRHWLLQGAFGWTAARYREFLFTPVPGGPAIDLSGNAFYQTPKFNVGLGVGYERALAGGRLRANANYAWQDKVQFSVINDFNNQGAYGTLNARLAYSFGGRDQWEVVAFGTNLTGRRYAITGGSVVVPDPSGTGTSAATSWQIPGPPRFWGVGLRYQFDSHG